MVLGLKSCIRKELPMKNEMRKNKVKKMLKAGKKVVGTFLASNSISNLEVLAMAGFDFVVIDAEHSMKNPETIEHLIITSEAAGITPFVRIQENIDLIERTLSVGARGIMVPMCSSKEYAQLVVDTAKYAPIGKRGVCNTRAANYGMKGLEDMSLQFKSENDNILIIAQIETKEAVDNLQEIMSVKGIDMIFVGPLDLSNSLGISCQFDHPELEKQIQGILRQAKKVNIPIGNLAFDGEEANRCFRQGFDFISMSCDTLFLADGAVRQLIKVKR
jgi:4-hydroxy-2-oxoheptanedioate aldolase